MRKIKIETCKFGLPYLFLFVLHQRRSCRWGTCSWRARWKRSWYRVLCFPPKWKKWTFYQFALLSIGCIPILKYVKLFLMTFCCAKKKCSEEDGIKWKYLIVSRFNFSWFESHLRLYYLFWNMIVETADISLRYCS